MSRADSGGFDLALHLAVDAIRRQLAPVVAAPVPDAINHVEGWGDLRFHLQLALTDLTVHPDTSIEVAVSTAGTSFSWPAIANPFGGAPVAPAGTAPLNFSVAITGTPTASGTSLGLRFAADAASVHIAAGTLEAIPIIQAWLALVDLLQGHAAREAERARIYAAFEDSLESGLNAALPDSVPLGTLPSPPVRAVQIAARGQELRILMTVGGTAGSPAAITRSPIRRSPAGFPLDIAGVVVGNDCLLRDILRPVLRTGLSLPSSGFIASHPCAWTGTAPLPASATVAGIRPAVKSVMTGIDSAGMVRVLISFEGTHSSGLFGLTGTINLGFGATITGTGTSRTLTLSVATSVVSGLDIWVNGWLYVAGIFLAPTLALALALIDAFAGGALASAINGAVRGALGSGTLSLPLPSGGVGPTTLRLAQPDAEPQTFSVPGIPFALPDPFPNNDAILTIG